MFVGGRGGGLIPPDAKIIQIDPDAAEMGRLFPVDQPLVGNCASTLDALARAKNWQAPAEWCAKAIRVRNIPDSLCILTPAWRPTAFTPTARQKKS